MNFEAHKVAMHGSGVAVGVAAGILIGSLLPPHAQPGSPEKTEVPAFPSSPYPDSSCIEVSGAEQLVADQLLSATNAPELVYRYAGGKSDYSYRSIFFAEAAANHLTVQDGDQLSDELTYDAITGQGDQSFERYFNTTKSFMAGLGVSLEVAAPDEVVAFSGHTPSLEALSSRGTKLALASIIRGYSFVPKEEVALSGERHIVLASGMEAKAAAYATPGEIVVDVTTGDSPMINEYTIAHERGHEFDYGQCVDVNVDPALEALNRGQDIYYGEDGKPSTPSYTSYFQTPEYKQLYQLEIDAVNRDDQPAVCAALEQMHEQADWSPTIDDYHPNPAEEKGSIYSYLLDGRRMSTVAERRLSIIYPKASLLFARIMKQNPNIAIYRAHTAAPKQQLAEERACQ